MDWNHLVQSLKSNGLNESSSVEEIDALLNAFRFDAEDKQRSIEFLKSKGWMPAPKAAPVQQPAPQPQPRPQVQPVAPVQPAPVQQQPIPQPQPEEPRSQPQFRPYTEQQWSQPAQQTPVQQQPQPVQQVPIQPRPQPQFRSFNPASSFGNTENDRRVFNSVQASSLSPKLLWMVGVIVVVVLIGGVVAFAFGQKIGLFGSLTEYSEDNFFSGLLMKASQIKSSTYSASASIGVVKREAGAKPFDVKVSNTAAIRQQYQNDSKRAADVNNLLSFLVGSKFAALGYTSSLTDVVNEYKKENPKANSSRIPGIVDPKTQRQYDFQPTEGGKNFALTITFETDEAIKEIKRNNNNSTVGNTVITGKKVTFSKTSYPYFYVRSEPEKPVLVELSDQLRFVPADMSATLAVTATTEFKNSNSLSDWALNIGAEGAFSDLTYKFNADALKKNNDYYFRINNIPGLFIGELATLKGQWVKVNAEQATSSKSSDGGYTRKDEITSFVEGFADAEKEYKKTRESATKMLITAATIADDLKLVTFKTKPKTETVDGRELKRYDIQIRKEAIIPFYTKFIAELDKEKDFKPFANELRDSGLLEYLQSPEFNEVYDFYTKNTQTVFWTDRNGFPAILQNTTRVVPPDTATQLKDKQINLVFKLAISKINEGVNISAPADAKPVQDVVKDFTDNLYGYDVSGLASIKSNLSNIRASAEIVYDRDANSYGKKVFALGSCKKTTGTLFGETNIYQAISDATNGKPSTARCASKLDANKKVGSYAVSVPLPDSPGYSWCIDSTGTSQQITGTLKKAQCN